MLDTFLYKINTVRDPHSNTLVVVFYFITRVLAKKSLKSCISKGPTGIQIIISALIKTNPVRSPLTHFLPEDQLYGEVLCRTAGKIRTWR